MSGIQSKNSELYCDNNGLEMCNINIPPEVILRILLFVDERSLLSSQQVCKRWNGFLVDYVWRKKAEIKTGYMFAPNTNLDWKDYFLMTSKNIFGRNLIKNHSGELGVQTHWQISRNGGNGWNSECPPIGVPPLPDMPVFENKQYCFVTSWMDCTKIYIIDLINEGFSEHILDDIRPTIKISEWYSCRWDCAAKYMLKVDLLLENGKIIREFVFRDEMEGDRQNVWHKIEHEFSDYGIGLRKIRFTHSGCDQQFWAGHYGSKMAGACVISAIPNNYKKLENCEKC